MKDKERKSRRDKKNINEKKPRQSKLDNEKNKKNVAESPNKEGKGVKMNKKDNIQEKMEDVNIPLQVPRSGVSKLPTNNINLQRELPIERVANYSDPSFRKPKDLPINMNNYERLLNEKLLKNGLLQRQEKTQAFESEKKGIKIKRTPKDYGVGEYNSVKIHTKCINGRLFHNVNIQTLDNNKRNLKRSPNDLDYPIYGRKTLNNTKYNNISSLKSKVSRNLELQKKDVVLAKIQHLQKAIDKLNNRYAY
uniref:Coiled-coil domain-containing protein n=1 Tax=Strongyloides papillosus TaxID=174720 RepID=A0A0N5C577_STREA